MVNFDLIFNEVRHIPDPITRNVDKMHAFGGLKIVSQNMNSSNMSTLNDITEANKFHNKMKRRGVL